MQVSKYLTKNKDIPIQYYYCNIDDKDYILTGTRDGVLFNEEKKNAYNMGSMIIEFNRKRKDVIEVINEYIKIINNLECSDNEDFNQCLIIHELDNLQNKLCKNISELFYFSSIAEYISDLFIKEFNKLNIQKEELKSKQYDLKELKKLIDTRFQENKKLIRHIIDKQNIEAINVRNLENQTFKSFTINTLKRFIDDIDILNTNLILYCHSDNKRYDPKKYLTQLFLLQQNHNLFVSEIECYQEMVFIDKGSLIFEPDINKMKNITSDLEFRIIEIFKFNSIIELLNLSLTRIIDKDIKIRQCYNCQELFIPTSRSDEKYCNYSSPQNPNKTCKEYGVNKTYREKMKSTPIKNEHNRTSQAYRMRIKRAKTNTEKEKLEKKFERYKTNYQNKKVLYNKGKLQEVDFIKWIIEQKGVVSNGSIRKDKK